MNDPNYEHSDGNWDEFRNEPNWSEYQWRKYLQSSDRDTARFLSIYNKFKDQPNHLDAVAVEMGWDAEDISLTDELSPNAPEADIEAPLNDHENAPYTLHRHPVIVVTRALYRYLHQSWEHYMVNNQSHASPQLCWNYANSLHQAEMNVLFSIQALDLGDFGLAICHLKNSLSGLNQTLALLNQVKHPNLQFLAAFRNEQHIRLFDLREVWIRVMSDCRTEYNRRPEDSQD
jgi:hypothetical protein